MAVVFFFPVHLPLKTARGERSGDAFLGSIEAPISPAGKVLGGGNRVGRGS